jgi:hypothetical protein
LSDSAARVCIQTHRNERQRYVQLSVKAHVEDRQFTTLLDQGKYHERGAGKKEDGIEGIIQELVRNRTTGAQGITEAHLMVSHGANETADAMLKRVLGQMPGARWRPSRRNPLRPRWRRRESD